LEKSVKEIQIGDLIAVGSLDLNGTQVADLAALQNLSSLEKLDINGTPVTEEAVEALKEALPKLTVVS
jgi:Leucine-rich repeat (LRR) protein